MRTLLNALVFYSVGLVALAAAAVASLATWVGLRLEQLLNLLAFLGPTRTLRLVCAPRSREVMPLQ